MQKYWKTLLKLIQEGKLDPTMVITHRMPLDEAARGYKIFNDKHEEDGTLVQKVGAQGRRVQGLGEAGPGHGDHAPHAAGRGRARVQDLQRQALGGRHANAEGGRPRI